MLLVSLALTVLVFAPTWSTIENGVQYLTDGNFSDKTKAHDWCLVMFYKHWCTKSKKVMKEFERAAEFLDRGGEPVRLAKMDCESDGAKTCDKFRVSNIPVLFLFRRGNYYKEYKDKPDYSGIVRFIKGEIGPGYSVIKSDEEMDMFFSGREVMVLGRFDSSDSSMKKSFLSLVNEWKNKFDFGLVESLDEGDDKENIVLHRPKHLRNKFEPFSIKFQGSSDANEIENWMIENKHGLVGHRHKYNYDEFKEPLVVVYYSVDYERAQKVTNYWRNRVIKVAISYPEFNFAISAVKDFQREMVNFGYNFMRPPDSPVVCSFLNNRRYPMKEDFSMENLKVYLEEFKSGNIKPHMRSEPVPESNEGPVKIAVGLNFQELVNESGRDSLIKFYAPWCTWCKKLAPIWEQLGTLMQDEDVDIIKINGESNEVPTDYSINGFPTIFWAPKDSKRSPVLYESGRDVKDFIKFIAERSSKELKEFDRQGERKNKEEKEEL